MADTFPLSDSNLDDHLRCLVAKAIGRVIWGGEVLPQKNWLVAADAAINAMRAAPVESECVPPLCSDCACSHRATDGPAR